jgi:hypothetical protein
MLKFEENGEILKLSCFFFMTKNVSLSAADPIVKKKTYINWAFRRKRQKYGKM